MEETIDWKKINWYMSWDTFDCHCPICNQNEKQEWFGLTCTKWVCFNCIKKYSKLWDYEHDCLVEELEEEPYQLTLFEI